MFSQVSVHKGEGVGFPVCITGHMTSIGGGLGFRGADPSPAGTRKVDGEHTIGMPPCWNHIYFWLLLFLIVFD